MTDSLEPSADELQSRLQFALDMSVKADELIMSYYRDAGLTVEVKGDDSPVTLADRGAEKLMRELIAKEYPGDGVIGEEFENTESQSGYRWILDPVDGTKAFVYGVPQFGTLIGMESPTGVDVGVCRFPALNEVMYAARGSGAWWRTGNEAPRACHVTDTDQVRQALLCFTEVSGYRASNTMPIFERLTTETRLSRGWGDCFGHMMVATGRADIAVDPEMNPWDAAALLPIVEEAGGHYLDWGGNATVYGSNGVSVNAALKDEILSILQS